MNGVEPFLPDRFPIFNWDVGDGTTLYGFPAVDGPKGGVKVAYHHGPKNIFCSPQTIDRIVHEEEIQIMRRGINRIIPSLNAPCLASTTCLYTNSPDGNFIITMHPKCRPVSIACGFSGHGYKFCSVVGEIMADLAIRGETQHDISLFSPQRFSRNEAPGR